MQIDKEVVVNLQKGIAKIIITKTIDLFENNRFVIEYDDGGFSCIEKREDGYHHVNYLRKRDTLGNWLHGTEEPIDDKKISPSEAREIIREILWGHSP